MVVSYLQMAPAGQPEDKGLFFQIQRGLKNNGARSGEGESIPEKS